MVYLHMCMLLNTVFFQVIHIFRVSAKQALLYVSKEILQDDQHNGVRNGLLKLHQCWQGLPDCHLELPTNCPGNQEHPKGDICDGDQWHWELDGTLAWCVCLLDFQDGSNSICTMLFECCFCECEKRAYYCSHYNCNSIVHSCWRCLLLFFICWIKEHTYMEEYMINPIFSC